MHTTLLPRDVRFQQEQPPTKSKMRPPYRNPILAATHYVLTLFTFIVPCINKICSILTPSFLHRRSTTASSVNQNHQNIAYSQLATAATATPPDLEGQSLPRIQHCPSTSAPKLSTAWIDGVRGLASFFVFLFHYGAYGHPNIKVAYGGNPEQTSLLQLPIIRLIFHGRTMVGMFFIVSGYALSFSPLKLIRQRNYETLCTRLASSVFRRAIRLYVPTIVAASSHLVAQRLGLITISDAKWLPDHDEPYVSTFWNDLNNFWDEMSDLLNPFTWRTDTGGARFYGPQLWTIPVELRASLVLFITVLGLSRCKTWVRIGIVAVIGIGSMVMTQWDVSLFMAGIALAECNLVVHERSVAKSNLVDEADVELVEVGSGGGHKEVLGIRTRDSRRNLRRLFVKSLLISTLIFGLYLASYPTRRPQKTNVYKWLAGLGPKDTDFKSRAYVSIGACITVAAVSFMPRCQAILETTVVRYMGRISFALYLTHPLMNSLVGFPLVKFMWSVIGTEGWVRYEGAWFLGTLIYVPVVVWVADIFWRLVDIPVVDLARTVEKWCSVP